LGDNALANAKRIVRAVNSFEELLAALKPFADAAMEVRTIADIAATQQYVWKPQNGNRPTAGITAHHLQAALAAIQKVKAHS
jgi:hypothetical protein